MWRWLNINAHFFLFLLCVFSRVGCGRASRYSVSSWDLTRRVEWKWTCVTSVRSILRTVNSAGGTDVSKSSHHHDSLTSWICFKLFFAQYVPCNVFLLCRCFDFLSNYTRSKYGNYFTENKRFCVVFCNIIHAVRLGLSLAVISLLSSFVVSQ